MIKNIARLATSLLVLTLYGPIAAMQKMQQIAEVKKDSSSKEALRIKDAKPETLRKFGAIYTPKKKVAEVDEKTKATKNQILEQKFIAFAEAFFKLGEPQNFPLYGNKAPQEIMDLTLLALTSYTSSPQEYNLFLALPTPTKIRVLHFADYMLAPQPFLMSIAKNIRDDIASNPKCYAACKDEIEACSFQITTQTCKTTGITYKKPALLEDCDKGFDNFIATSRDVNKLDTEKTFYLGTHSRILTIDRVLRSGTFVLKENGSTTAQHKLDNLNPLVEKTSLDSTGYIFCDGIDGKKNCIINLTTGAYYCAEKSSSSSWPSQMANAQHWLPEEMPGHVTTRLITKQNKISPPEALCEDRGSKEAPKIEREYVIQVEKIYGNSAHRIKTIANACTPNICISTVDSIGDEVSTCESVDTLVGAGERYAAFSPFRVSVLHTLAHNTISISFKSDYPIDGVRLSPDGNKLFIDENVEDIHYYHTFELGLHQRSFATWVKEDQGCKTVDCYGTTKESIFHQKQLCLFGAALGWELSVIGIMLGVTLAATKLLSLCARNIHHELGKTPQCGGLNKLVQTMLYKTAIEPLGRSGLERHITIAGLASACALTTPIALSPYSTALLLSINKMLCTFMHINSMFH